MGEAQETPFRLSFNTGLLVDFQGSRVTSDGGLLVVRELDERLGLGELIERHLCDRRGKNTQLPLTDLVRQSIYSRLAGYEDLNDAKRLSQDPAFRLIGSPKVVARGAAGHTQRHELALGRYDRLLEHAGRVPCRAALSPRPWLPLPAHRRPRHAPRCGKD